MAVGGVAERRGRNLVLAGLFGAATLMVVATSAADAAPRKKNRGGGYNPPYAAMVVDAKTGRTLHAVNEDDLRFPASITKVMTLYLLFEQLEQGRVTLSTPLEVSENASRQAPSKLGLRPGQTISVENAILALVTKSANDVAVVVAENLGGSVEGFAQQMTRKARALGMSRTVYRNPHGLPNPQQVTTARDLIVLGRAVQEHFPQYYRYFETRVFNYAGNSHRNHNKLLGRVEGVDGIKTGFTRASGFNLLTSVKTDNRHIVAVVLGGRSGASRDQAMANLVGDTLPRAYAGNRTAPVVAAAPPAPVPNVDTTAATTPARSSREPLQINNLRPVVASAAGAASTTTPSSTLRWSTGPQPVPQSAQAFAAVSQETAKPMPLSGAQLTADLKPPAAVPAAPAPKLDERLRETVVRSEPTPAPVRTASIEAPRQAAQTPSSAWVIQVAAVDDEGKAKEILSEARSRGGRVLSQASPFTEKVERGGTTLFRARFSGFDAADEAQDACKALKRSGFACFATRS